jgi:hypothetical protein
MVKKQIQLGLCGLFSAFLMSCGSSVPQQNKPLARASTQAHVSCFINDRYRFKDVYAYLGDATACSDAEFVWRVNFRYIRSPISTATWQGQVTNLEQRTVTRIAVLDDYFNNSEIWSNKTFVDSFYAHYLMRRADDAGRNHWVPFLDNGSVKRADLRDLFMDSAEAKIRIPDDNFVSSLLEIADGANSTPERKAYWIARLKDGLRRSDMRDWFVNQANSAQLAVKLGEFRGSINSSFAPPCSWCAQ